MMTRSSKLLTMPFLASALLGLALGFAPSLFSSENGSGGAETTDRGDNPVVGSLPCLTTDSLGFMAAPDPYTGEGPVQPTVPIMALVGDGGDDCAIIAAAGEPFGRVDDDNDFGAFGLVRNGVVALNRFSFVAQGNEMWQWLPEGYVGGTIEFESDWGGSRELTITTQSIPIPLQQYAASSTMLGTAHIRMRPAPGHEALGTKRIHVLLNPSTIFLQYAP